MENTQSVPCMTDLSEANLAFITIWFILQGITARVYETSVVLILLAVLVTSIVWVGMALIDRGRSSDEGAVVNLLQTKYIAVWIQKLGSREGIQEKLGTGPRKKIFSMFLDFLGPIFVHGIA